MWWFLACTLLVVGGCGESEPEQGATLITIGSALPNYHDPELTCENSPPPPPPDEDRVVFGNPCEYRDSGECEMFTDSPPGKCTLLIRIRDGDTGEVICVEEEEFVILENGDTVDVALDECAPAEARVQ